MSVFFRTGIGPGYWSFSCRDHVGIIAGYCSSLRWTVPVSLTAILDQKLSLSRPGLSAVFYRSFDDSTLSAPLGARLAVVAVSHQLR